MQKPSFMDKPTNFDSNQLCCFADTSSYRRICPKYLITDGIKCFDHAAGAYWLMDAAAGHLEEVGTANWFVLIKL